MPQDVTFRKNNPNRNIEIKSKPNQILTCIVNMIYFGLGIAMLAIGILYLTVYKYEYSFTSFHPTLMSGIFITFGFLIVIMAILSIIFMLLSRKPFLFLIVIFSFVILAFFIVLLALGIWGLAVDGDSNALAAEARSKMLQTIKYYDYNDANTYETRAINWLQIEFKCCGVDSSSDWRLYCNGYGIYNSNRYSNYVPDSCCINPRAGCGKQANTNTIYQNQSIYNNGCLSVFVHHLRKDISFLAAFSVTISCLAIILWLIHVVLYFLFKKRSNN